MIDLASWAAIEAVSLTILGILDRHLKAVLGAAVGVELITPASFERLATSSSAAVSIFLYRVEENRVVRNQARRVGSGGVISRQVLPIDLCYMITAWASRPTGTLTASADAAASREEHRMLGLVLQALSANAELGASDLVEPDPTNPVFSSTDDVQIILESLPIEDHYRIWDPDESGYRLSLTYRVRLVGIDPVEPAEAPRVSSAESAWGEM